MFAENSRYKNVKQATFVNVEGRSIAYVRRRIIPSQADASVLAEVDVKQGERLDLIAARVIGDSEQAWRIADANNAMRPDELTSAPGRTLRITLPQP